MNGVSSPMTSSLMNYYTYMDWFTLIDSPNNIEVIGQLVYTHEVYFFILSGLVLLVAMVGAIVLTSQNKDKTVRVQQVFHQLSRNPKTAIFLTSISDGKEKKN